MLRAALRASSAGAVSTECAGRKPHLVGMERARMRALRGLSAAAAGAILFTASPALAAGVGSTIPSKATAATTSRYPLGLHPLKLRIAASAHLTGGRGA